MDLDDEVGKLRRVIDGLGEDDERTGILIDMLEQWEHFSRGGGALKSKSKPKKAYARKLAFPSLMNTQADAAPLGSGSNSKAPEGPLPLNTALSGKRQIHSQLSGAQSHIGASSSANNGFGAPHNRGADNSTSLGNPSSPASPSPGVGSPGSNHSSSVSVGDLLLNIPSYLSPPRRSGIKTIGARPDTLCKECFYTGHDQRSQACPANILRRALFLGSPKDLQDTGNSCQDISDILAWEASQPASTKANDALRQKLETLHAKFTAAWNLLNSPQVGTDSQGQYSNNSGPQVPSTPQKRSYHDVSFEEKSTPPMTSLHQTPQLQGQLKPPTRSEQTPLPGICIDHSKLDSPMLMELLPFVINGQETRGLRVDHAKMSPQLVMAIAPFMIADTPLIHSNSYQDGQRKESRKSPEQSSPHGGFTPINNPRPNNFPGQSQFHPSTSAFQATSGAIPRAGSSNQYTNSMADLQDAQYQPGTKKRRGNL